MEDQINSSTFQLGVFLTAVMHCMDPKVIPNPHARIDEAFACWSIWDDETAQVLQPG